MVTREEPPGRAARMFADAGEDRTVTVSRRVILQGRAGPEDARLSTYWKQIGGRLLGRDQGFTPEFPGDFLLFNQGSLRPNFIAPDRPDRIVLRLEVEDEYGNRASDTVTITVVQEDTPDTTPPKPGDQPAPGGEPEPAPEEEPEPSTGSDPDHWLCDEGPFVDDSPLQDIYIELCVGETPDATTPEPPSGDSSPAGDSGPSGEVDTSGGLEACAGPDLMGAPGETVTLQGRCSTNPSGPWHHLTHAWTQLNGPEVQLSDPTRGDPSFTIPANAADGTLLEFQLTVTDQEGQSDSDAVVVTVDSTPPPTPPTACAGDDLEAQPGDTVTLEGTCSTNPHGVWWRMAHLWTQPEGQNIALSDPTKGRPTFTVPADAAPGTVYTFTLTVTDKDGESDSDSMTVTVPGGATGDSQAVDPPPNQAPSFGSGVVTTLSVDENSSAGTNVGAAITATDPDGDTLTYTLSGADAASFSIDNTGQIATKSGVVYDYETKASYSLTVNVNDGNGGTASIAVTVILTNVAEVQAVIEPEPEVNAVTACATDVGSLDEAAVYAGSLDDDACKAHHQDSRARYFEFTVSEETTVTITLTSDADAALYVSRDTPKNGWGSVPGPGYEHRVNVRRDNGKLVHDGSNTVTLTLAAGTTYTVEAAGDSGDFTISISPH